MQSDIGTENTPEILPNPPQGDNVVPLTDAQKAGQKVVDVAAKEFAELKEAITNLVNLHNLINQGSFKGAQYQSIAVAEEWIRKMYEPLKAQLDVHPMFLAEQEEMKKKDAEMRQSQISAQMASVAGQTPPPFRAAEAPKEAPIV